MAGFDKMQLTGGAKKALPIAMGLAMAIGVTVLLPDFSLIGSSGFLGILLLFGISFYFVYIVIHKMLESHQGQTGDKKFALALSYVLVGLPGIPLLANAGDFGAKHVGDAYSAGPATIVPVQGIASILAIFWLIGFAYVGWWALHFFGAKNVKRPPP